MPKIDTRHMIPRNGWWHLNIRLSGTTKTYRKSLKTKSHQEAIKQRNQLLQSLGELTEKTNETRQLLEIRKIYLNTIREDERKYLREKLEEESLDKAHALNVMHLYAGPVVDSVHQEIQLSQLSDEERKPLDDYKIATAQLTPFKVFKDDWLNTISNNKTRSDYSRAIQLLMEEFAVVEELTWEKAKAFLRKVKEEKSVSVPTVRKWKSAYINLWRWLDERPDVWTNHTFQKEVKVSRQEWTKDEVAYLYKTLCEKNDKISHWLKHALWIAVHTGARQGAIAELEYNSSDQTIFFPAKRREEQGRTIPAHPAIRESLRFWVKNRKTANSISNRFGEFKKSLGYTDSIKVFHCFRNTFITEMTNLGCDLFLTKKMVGHYIPDITGGTCLGVPALERMKKYLFKLNYQI